MFSEPDESKPERRWQGGQFNGQNGLMAKTIAVQLHVRMYVYAFVLKAPKSGQGDFRPGGGGGALEALPNFKVK